MSSPNSKADPQVVDAVTAINAMNLALAPAMAMGSLYNNLANQAAMAAMNAVYAQQQAFITHQTATVEGVAAIYAAISKR